jgi:hypothetical protein
MIYWVYDNKTAENTEDFMDKEGTEKVFLNKLTHKKE